MALTPLLVLLLLIAVITGSAAAVRRAGVVEAETTVAQAQRHAHRTSVSAVIIGVLVAAGGGCAAMMPAISGAAMAGRAGVAAMTVPLAFGLGHTGAVLVGELTWPRPMGAIRHARLVHRRALQPVPGWLLRTAAATLTAGIVLIAIGAAVAAPDGRSVTVRAGAGLVAGAASPFVGTGYGLPALVGLGALLAVALLALRVVADRPAVVTDHAEVEAGLRRASAARVMRGATAAAMVVVGGLAAVSGLAVRSAATGAAETARLNELPVGAAATVLPWGGALLTLVGGACALGGVVVLFARTSAGTVEPVAAGH